MAIFFTAWFFSEIKLWRKKQVKCLSLKKYVIRTKNSDSEFKWYFQILRLKYFVLSYSAQLKKYYCWIGGSVLEAFSRRYSTKDLTTKLVEIFDKWLCSFSGKIVRKGRRFGILQKSFLEKPLSHRNIQWCFLNLTLIYKQSHCSCNMNLKKYKLSNVNFLEVISMFYN